MQKSDIENKIKGVLESYGLEAKQLNSNAILVNDLGLDSLDLAELILITEKTFDISISFDNDNINTVGDLVNTIENNLNTNLINKT